MSTRAPILVVEDDGDLAEIIGCNLAGAGYDVITAVDGLDALQTFETEKPSLVVLDLMMPTVSGFRLIHLFKRMRPNVPIIVATALQFEEAEDAVRAGADDFVTKPFDPAVIVAKVQHFLAPPDEPAEKAGTVDVPIAAVTT